ncbi:MAG: phosphoribosylglycinamide formyltransferase [Candidatus Nanopelagicales bacterium]|nr:phosphoribosylglycinamide formyltransferase [Candidatus Nanopelagicales bacterium]
MSSRIVVLASGSGTLLQALLDSLVGSQIVGVVSDVPACGAVIRAQAAGVATVVVEPSAFADRGAWNAEMLTSLESLAPNLVVSAGFMRILGPSVVSAFRGRLINTHPALLPSFPGAHGVRDALAYGVRVSGCTLHYVDEGVDTGQIIAQRAVPVLEHDDEPTLHERIKVQERSMLIEALLQFVATGAMGTGAPAPAPAALPSSVDHASKRSTP